MLPPSLLHLLFARAVFPSFVSGHPASSTCIAGDSCRLWCGATGVPSPSVYWFHNGVLVTDGDQASIASSSSYNAINTTLTYAAVNVTQAGNYHCVADNFLVESASANSSLALLTVHCKCWYRTAKKIGGIKCVVNF